MTHLRDASRTRRVLPLTLLVGLLVAIPGGSGESATGHDLCGQLASDSAAECTEAPTECIMVACLSQHVQAYDDEQPYWCDEESTAASKAVLVSPDVLADAEADCSGAAGCRRLHWSQAPVECAASGHDTASNESDVTYVVCAYAEGR